MFGDNWSVVDTFAQHEQWLYPVSFALHAVEEGILYYRFTADPPTPSTEANMKILKTTDDGQTWTTILDYFDYSYQDYELEFVHPDTGFFTFNYMGFIHVKRTNDGGASWQYLNYDYLDAPQTICFKNGSKGYGQYMDKFMRYENDTFRVVDTLDWYITQSKLGFTDNQCGYMIGKLTFTGKVEHVLRTLNDGDEWQVSLHDPERTFHDVEVPSETESYVSCDSGWIYKTDDQGETSTAIG